MRAVILAGGLGTRLRPYTTVIPKPLVPIGDRPVLEHIIQSLARSGVDNIDLPAATAKGILVLNTAEASTLSTAEHALALMLSLARKGIGELIQQQKLATEKAS